MLNKEEQEDLQEEHEGDNAYHLREKEIEKEVDRYVELFLCNPISKKWHDLVRNYFRFLDR